MSDNFTVEYERSGSDVLVPSGKVQWVLKRGWPAATKADDMVLPPLPKQSAPQTKSARRKVVTALRRLRTALPLLYQRRLLFTRIPDYLGIRRLLPVWRDQNIQCAESILGIEYTDDMIRTRDRMIACNSDALIVPPEVLK